MDLKNISQVILGYEGPTIRKDMLPINVEYWNGFVDWELLETMIQCSYHLFGSLIHLQWFSSPDLSCSDNILTMLIWRHDVATYVLLRPIQCFHECIGCLMTNME